MSVVPSRAPAAPAAQIIDLATYLGGGGEDGFESQLAVDAAGYIYLAGKTSSTDFPTRRAFDGTPNGGKDAFIAKLDPSGGNLVFSTYLGGSGLDMVKALSVDGSGCVFIAGRTTSTDFPTTSGALQSTCAVQGSSCSDAFVAKFSSDGSSLVFSTYLGGAGTDHHDVAEGLWLDDSGDVYVTGYTQSTDFPTSVAIQPQCSLGAGASPCYDAFVAKLDAAGANLLYSTFLGGSGDDSGRSIVVDASGNAYVGGSTTSPDFPTSQAMQPVAGGDVDGVLLKIGPTGAGDPSGMLLETSSSGSSLVYSTYLGGVSADVVNGLEIGPSGEVFAVGATSSADFPTAAAFQARIGGSEDAFVSKVRGSSGELLFSTFLGGNRADRANDLAVDGAGNVFVTGRTKSAGFPTVNSIQGSLSGVKNAFVSVMDGAGTGWVSSTYFGGTGPTGDVAYGITVDRSGAAYVVMQTDSTDLPLKQPLQVQVAGGLDAFLFKMAPPLKLWIASARGGARVSASR
jgi:hypothetical protein